MKSKLKKIKNIIVLIAFLLTGGMGLVQNVITPAKARGPFGRCGAWVIDYGAEKDGYACIYHFFRCECTRN
jgi:hypothetical protein